MHAFMAAVLLRMARLDALDGNAEPQPPNGEREGSAKWLMIWNRRFRNSDIIGRNPMPIKMTN
jgi:hypothetical protein